ncbi:fungal chitosanase of glycosyl hydrolase group 75-domain-containing protein [Lasiosphaeria miniovina]|uniref:Endo-chitosanase n=1 Tax=Lasiosphaeria miniovina TaxID=1954250 RepID=A0AA40A632_9PEZI|nr:fungal chitosanase of glycosyl hydrolase group 75-domain-containing protein [Lasiosphaeria miniovina]KAK0709932.1 fungal chitosanase of glycosyl hydrolase group 75-domain-containing protein [Lasiosphaeria miniovina]
MPSAQWLGRFVAVLYLSFLFAQVAARNVPSNVRKFYNDLKNGTGGCSKKLATGFWSSDSGSNSFSYCEDWLSSYGIIYIKGSGSAFANMDVDCDGAPGGSADDGRCGKSNDTQSITAFQWLVEGYGKGISDLNARVHPYVVFGNTGKKKGWKKFDPQQYGIEPLSVMAVVCGKKLIFGVWGDMNGDDGDHPLVGEASISLATACFGKGINGNSGHDEDDVLYIAFTGARAVPGAKGADWAAKDYADFEKSIEGLGNSLVAKIGGTKSGGGNPGGGKGGGGNDSGQNCEWPGHCAGSACKSDDDCSGSLACVNLFCSPDP